MDGQGFRNGTLEVNKTDRGGTSETGGEVTPFKVMSEPGLHQSDRLVKFA